MDILERAMTAMPQVVEASGRDLLDGILVEEAGYSQRAGYQYIGIICKNAVESQALYDRLREKINLIGWICFTRAKEAHCYKEARYDGEGFEVVDIYDA